MGFGHTHFWLRYISLGFSARSHAPQAMKDFRSDVQLALESGQATEVAAAAADARTQAHQWWRRMTSTGDKRELSKKVFRKKAFDWLIGCPASVSQQWNDLSLILITFDTHSTPRMPARPVSSRPKTVIITCHA